MRIVIQIICICFLTFGACTTPRWQQELNTKPQYQGNDSLLKSLQEKYETALISYSTSSWVASSRVYYILVKEKGGWQRKIYAYNRQSGIIDSDWLPVETNSADSAFRLFAEPGFISIRDKDEGYCPHLDNYSDKTKASPCGIFDASTSNLVFIYKGKILEKNYYAPDYYERECCPGNKDRQVFLEARDRLQRVIGGTTGAGVTW